MIRVLALDMDDTLLRSDGTISPQTLSLLERWQAMGNHLIIATGRPPRTIGASLPPLLHEVPWICYNGAEVRLRNEIIFSDLIPTEDVRHVIEWGLATLPTWRIGIEVNDTLYMNRRLDPPKRHTYAPDLLRVASEPAAKVLFSDAAWNGADPLPDDVDPFAPLTPLLTALPAYTRSILSRRYRLAQLLSISADKAVALRHMVGKWGLGMEQVMAFGDDTNDVDMLASSGVGVAMANAVPEVLAAADQVTTTNDEDGVAAVLSTLMD